MNLRATLLKFMVGFQIKQDLKSNDPIMHRVNIEKSARLLRPSPDITLEPVRANGVPAEWITAPGVKKNCALLHLHGGGYYTGSIDTTRDLVSRLGRAAGMRGLAIDYRLAPEHPYPAAVEDATCAYRWLLAEGFNPANVVLSGDSSGGGLALATLINLRDAGDPLPGAAVCLSPWTDLALTGNSIKTKAKVDPINKLSYMKNSSRLYAGEHDLKTPLISPLYAALHGLPPLLIHVGTDETFLDDSTRFAERAGAAGVEVTLKIWQDMFHIFHMNAKFLPEARQAIKEIGEFIQQKILTTHGGEA